MEYSQKGYWCFNYDDDILRKPLPYPKDEKEYKLRLQEYHKDKEDRKTEFLKKSLEGYQRARRLYYYALRHIYFVILGQEEDFKKVVDEKGLHEDHLKKVVIAMRKIAECCYFLGRFKESLQICDDIIRIVRDHKTLTHIMLKLTLGIIGRIMIECGRLKEAKIAIELGLCSQPRSGFLQRAEEWLEKVEKKEDFESEREKVIRVSNVSNLLIFPNGSCGKGPEEMLEESKYSHLRNLEDLESRYNKFYNDVYPNRREYTNISQKTEWTKISVEKGMDQDFFQILLKLRPGIDGVNLREIKLIESDLRSRIEYLCYDEDKGFVSLSENRKFLMTIVIAKRGQSFSVLKLLF